MVGIAPSAVNTEMQKQALDGAITADVSLCHENWGGCDDGSIFIILAKQVVNQTGATNTGLLEPEEVSKEFLFDKLRPTAGMRYSSSTFFSFAKIAAF